MKVSTTSEIRIQIIFNKKVKVNNCQSYNKISYRSMDIIIGIIISILMMGMLIIIDARIVGAIARINLNRYRNLKVNYKIEIKINYISVE